MKFQHSLRLSVFLGILAALSTVSAQVAPAAPEPPPPPKASPESIVDAVANVATREEAAADIQQRINVIADETVDLESQYKTVLRELETVNAYNDQMMRVVSSQEEEIAILKTDLENLQDTQRQIIPLLLKMIDALGEFVAEDTPFLYDERSDRVEELKLLMDRGDITIAEKFRNVMDAYLEENSYSRNIEAYTGQIEQNGVSSTVEFLRIGRVALFVSSLDESTISLWDTGSEQWAVVEDPALQLSIKRAFKIARKEIPVDLLLLPVKN
ncbi:MAG: DUF3450 domain-containing protein [Verrucomicrobiota bacterium]